MNIGLYFGSFNPIHIGHLIIGNTIANTSEVDQVWFVVSPQNPLKNSNSLLNEYNRLHLVRLAIEGNPLLKLSDVEFKLPRPSYTIDTLIHLKEKYEQHSFAVILGSDSYNNIKKWKNYEQLMMENTLLVYERPGFPVNLALSANIRLVTAPLLEISSTFIRSLIKKGLSIKYLVTQQVEDEIEKSHYYKDL